MTTSVRLSVILPVKNGENYLQDALHSLQQNLSELDEVICINDDSSDQTSHILNQHQTQLPLRIFNRKSKTVAESRNFGIKNSRGIYITFIDHDDYWPKDRVKNHLNILNQEKNVDVVRGKTSIIDQTKLNEENSQPDKSSKIMHHVNLGAMTFRSSVFDSIGIFDESLKFSEDQDFFMRLRDSSQKILSIDEVSLYYRIHENNMTGKVATKQLMLTDVLLRSIQRKRNSRN